MKKHQRKNTPTPENNGENNPMGFCLSRQQDSSSSVFCLQRRHAGREKAWQVCCHIALWAERHMLIWNLTDAKQSESMKRWESGIPRILKIRAENEQQMEPPASAAFSGRLAHIAGLSGVWNCEKGSDDEVPSTHMQLKYHQQLPQRMSEWMLCLFFHGLS